MSPRNTVVRQRLSRHRTTSPDAPLPSARHLPALLTMAEVRHELRICRVTVYQLLKQGRLKSLKIGSRRMFPASSVMRLLASAR
jgi:excisionase family DNA binding protein